MYQASFEEAEARQVTVQQPRADSESKFELPDAVEIDAESPGPFVYDPLTKRSRKNHASLRIHPGQEPVTALRWPVDDLSTQVPDGLTIEAFVKPDPRAAGDASLVRKSRSGLDRSELAIELHELANHHQTWHGFAFLHTQESRAQRYPIGHYSSSTRLTSEETPWRHLAVVYDARAERVTGWVDAHLSRSVLLERPLRWDDAPLLVGGRSGGRGFSGWLDEVRIVAAALGPADFLRARGDAAENLSFQSEQQIVPSDAGCFDVKEHFGAVGDGQTDDTAAFNAAFRHLCSKVPLAYNTLIIPPGEYLISDIVRCSRFIDIRGAGPDRSVLRLKDGVFRDPQQPQPVLRMSSTAGDPGSHSQVNGSSISLYLEGISIDTGRDNPGAKALEFHANNVGRLENVVLRSGDGSGALGLDLTHHDVGPALVKNVEIDGFDVGVAVRYQEYSMTIEHLRLRRQRVVGIRNQGNILAIRGLDSENRVSAIESEGANSMVTLVDSSLKGGSDQLPAIRSEGGLYCLRVKSDGYAEALVKRELVSQRPPTWKETHVAGPALDEYIGDQLVVGHGSPRGAIQLDIEETPTPEIPPVAEWINVLRYADRKSGDDWGPALQAAIDDGARVVYLPQTERYGFKTPVHLRGRLERLEGFGGELHWSPEVWRETEARSQRELEPAPPPLLIFDGEDHEQTIVLNRLGCVHVRHSSPGTLVLRSSSPNRFTTGSGGGKLFAEDVGGADWHFDHPIQVWVRQWNPESHAEGPCVQSRGATIWALGFKTEYESQKLLAEQGARTEILGAFIYPLGKIPEDRPIFENRNSQMALVYGVSVYHSNHALHILDVRGDSIHRVGNDQLRWAGSRARMDLFSSDGR